MESDRDHQGQGSASNEGSTLGENQLAQQLSGIARDLQEADSLQDTLESIVRAVVQGHVMFA
jgi:hypothetical protein